MRRGCRTVRDQVLSSTSCHDTGQHTNLTPDTEVDPQRWCNTENFERGEPLGRTESFVWAIHPPFCPQSVTVTVVYSCHSPFHRPITPASSTVSGGDVRDPGDSRETSSDGLFLTLFTPSTPET